MTGALMQKTILIAEDSADTRAMLCGTLADRGYRVVEAEDGGQAVELTRRVRPDLVVMDLNMPVRTHLGKNRRGVWGLNPRREEGDRRHPTLSSPQQARV